ncbi:MAG: aminotransferase class I/II-fold pyridoxal phosphate-dependent enzyme [Spirochaetaceae bacterium]|nr:aminotransferase class I/II-fold pyridoxal phosphate-dependent enzyme [Spirochaetaceae bacterium]
MIDLRSDTVTKPSPEMRRLMAAAKVGDDVYREDPTTGRLEEYAAYLTGKEAALLISSGTFGNLLAAMVLARRGTEVLMHEAAHTMIYEQSGISAIVGAKPVTIAGLRGILTAEAVEKKINKAVPYYNEETSLIIIENSHNFCGGTVWSKTELESLAAVANKYNLPIHLDGARIFNAAVAGGLSVKEISSYAGTITFCLSKGLGAPIGSVLCGDKTFIDKALRWRKMLGGGMRQTGVLAAAGLYALENNVERLAEDHNHAQLLAKAFNESDWAQAECEPETNIIFAVTKGPAGEMVAKLKDKGILCFAMGPKRIRMVTHLDVSGSDIAKACEAIKTVS